MWSVFPFIVFLTILLAPVQNIETIYDTDNLIDAQYFDCLPFTNILTNTYSLKYCIQRKDVTGVQRQINQCQKGATAHSFSSLFERDIHPSVVLTTFHSGIEQADRYGAYFFRRKLNNLSISIDDDVVCNCSSLKDVFGRHCEYELYFGPSLVYTLLGTPIFNDQQFLFGQLQRRRVCYISIDCDYGLLCLDWREICDGTQNCMDGTDEENCDEIEMNECEQNEFRCQNGLCIPEEYWVDGELDCQDASDELNNDMFERMCSRTKGIECDEHMCSAASFPCGDGRCTWPYMYSKQLTPSAGNDITFQCGTLRDLAFQCELHEPLPLWTITGGFCMFLPAAWGDSTNRTDEVLCEFLLKCRFSQKLSEVCPANDDIHRLLNMKCKTTFGRIPYPPGKLLSPRIHTFYKVDHQLTDGRLPDYVVINGQLRCPNFHLTIDEYQPLDKDLTMNYLSLLLMPYFTDWILCRLGSRSVPVPQLIRNYSSSIPHIEVACWNQWISIFNLSSVEDIVDSCALRCLSLYRIHDGINDCFGGTLDEKTIGSPIQHFKNHCLNCITHDKQAVCLPTNKISSSEHICTQGQDTYVAGTTIRIDSFKCTDDDKSQCHIIRDYITQSSMDQSNETVSTSMMDTSKVFPFIQYCDTYFDTEENIDETIACLNKWICAKNEYRCLTGQCIPFDWLCDGEWDCSDASDEQRLFLQNDDFIDEHNRRLLNFADIKLRCFNQYKDQAFSNICNITLEYPCLLANVDDPFNFTVNRPCIKLEQIGDGHADCFGKSDERNLLKCGSEVLGWSFGCTGNQNKCVAYPYFCSETTYFFQTCGTEDLNKACFYRKLSNCNGPMDVLCFNKTCQPNARCNHKWECLNGEDEYWCYFDPQSHLFDRKFYRFDRRIKYQSDTTLTSYLGISTNFTSELTQEPSFIQPIQQFTMAFSAEKHIRTVNSYSNDDNDNNIIDGFLNLFRREQVSIVTELPFICNRGIPIKHNDGHTKCLCSLSHYGDYCEFQADRISVVTHLNLTKYYQNYGLTIGDNSTILVSSTFRYAQRLIDRHEFHIYSNMKRMKQKFYFAYPRTTEFQSQKRRQDNGTHLYSIRFEAFSLKPTLPPKLIGVWHFPIQFELLPAFRFAKVLHFNHTNKNETCDLFCGLHGQCFRLENDIKQSICSCVSGWYGDRCNEFDEQCDDQCHPNALCRPRERGFINGDQRPACLCAHGWFGPTCHLTYPKCEECRNDGSCYPTYDLTHIKPFVCVCTTDFYGEYCQFQKEAVILRFDKVSTEVLATSIQYYNVKRKPMIDLYLREQQVYFGQPIETRMKYEPNESPSMIIIKSYTKHDQSQEPIFHLVYSQEKSDAFINITVQLVSENECAHTHTLFDTKTIQSISANLLVFQYHELCQFPRQNHSNIVCFRDDLYFCLCNMTLEHAQCLRFDPYSDTCQHCLSAGQCIRGNLQREQDFICLCRRCMYGSVCQFSTELFSFTLDSLIIKDVENQRDLSIAIYISITFLIFLLGCYSNLCSLFVFSRRGPRKVGVGNYLYLVSIINIISLFFVFIKIIQILLGSAGFLTNNTMNLILCKVLSSLLSITIRANYWLISLITIERLSSVLFLTNTTIKKPETSFLLSLITILIICGMHVHEIFYYTIVSADPQNINSTGILCVTNFNKRSWSIYNQVNVLIHHLVPFIIQVIGITLLIVLAATSRAKTTVNRTTGFSEILKKQFKLQKELYITPAVIIFAALPQLIFTTTFACKEFRAWQRYIILLTFICSFIPQICGFIIFVLPSTTYTIEFRNTKIGQHFFRLIRSIHKNNVGARK